VIKITLKIYGHVEKVKSSGTEEQIKFSQRLYPKVTITDIN